MKGVWDTLRRCHDDASEEDCFNNWWDDWVGENNCCNCGKGTVEIKLHTEYPILGWKEGGVVGKEGDEIRSSVRITFPYFECPECGLSYANWIHEEKLTRIVVRVERDTIQGGTHHCHMER